MSWPDRASAGDDVRRDDEPVFEEPWQARAFAVAVQLTERGEGDLPWETFQERLVEEIEAAGEDVEGTEAAYYEQWLRALERLLVEEGFVDEDELAERAGEFEAGDRDASEFVIGEHGHDHNHGHSHDHDHHGHEH
jgi:nitrile hydratase accessory protein